MANESPLYTMWLRQLSCSGCGQHEVEVHHVTGAGMGLRSHDHDALPMCHSCHMAFHGSYGMFSDWTKQQKREWQRECVEQLLTRYEGTF